MNHRKILSMMLISIMLVLLTVSIFPTVTADGPKAVYGTLYIDNGQGYEIADDGIEVKIIIDGDIFNTTTELNEISQRNYLIGIEQGYAATGYFYVGNDDLIPDDNKTVFIDNTDGKIKYLKDLHVTVSSGDDDDDDSGGGGGGGLPPAEPTNMPPVANASFSRLSGANPAWHIAAHHANFWAIFL